MYHNPLIIIVPLLLLAGCAGVKNTEPARPAAASPESAGAADRLLPRKLLFGNPDRSMPRISHDGRQIAWLAPKDGVMNVWVAPADDPSKARAVTNDKKRGIRIYFWAYTNRHILYLQDKDGDEDWHVYAVDLASDSTRDLTPFQKTQAQVQEVSPSCPNEILVGLNNREPKFHDIHRVNIETGERTLVRQNDGFAGFITDDDYHVRLANRMTKDGGAEYLRVAPDGSTEPFLKISKEDMLGTAPIGFDRAGTTLYMTDSRGRNTSALTAVDFKTNQAKALAADEKVDVDDVLRDPRDRKPQAVAFNYTRQRWEVLDPAIAPDIEVLRKVADGELSIVSRSLDDAHWIVAYILDDAPARFYRYERASRKATFLFTNRKALEGAPLAKMHPLVIPTGDGLELVCYLTVPRATDPTGAGTPTAPVPMVMDVHGGPWARDAWGLDPVHQWLANRGYAVLSVNFRGSTGFGKRFVNAGDLEWGRRMHEDLLTAKKWAVAHGITRDDTVAISGGSYGGYATLVGVTFTPDAFACGVDIVGPSSLVTLIESIPPYWAPLLDLFTTRVGDPRTEAGRKFLTERSPLTRADRITKPLLIGQGANDPRVKQAESDQIVRAMQAKKIPVTYVLFPDEGHGFARPENRLAFNAVSEQFYAKWLGGRAEPIGEDFRGSSITVPQGAQLVPGLTDALKR